MIPTPDGKFRLVTGTVVIFAPWEWDDDVGQKAYEEFLNEVEFALGKFKVEIETLVGTSGITIEYEVGG